MTAANKTPETTETELYEVVSAHFDKKKKSLNYTLKLEEDLTVSSGVYINLPFVRRLVALTKIQNKSEEVQGQKTFEFITWLFGDDTMEKIEDYYIEKTEDHDVPEELYGRLIETFFNSVYPKVG